MLETWEYLYRVSGHVFTLRCSVYNVHPLYTFHVAIYHPEREHFTWQQVVLVMDFRTQYYETCFLNTHRVSEILQLSHGSTQRDHTLLGLHVRQWDSTEELFLNSWLLICCDRGSLWSLIEGEWIRAKTGLGYLYLRGNCDGVLMKTKCSLATGSN